MDFGFDINAPTLGSKKLGTDSLLNGLPVTVKTVQWGGGLIASAVKFRNGDFKTASMIRRGTAQGFAEQSAATEALRSRVADIDNYNVKGTTNILRVAPCDERLIYRVDPE